MGGMGERIELFSHSPQNVKFSIFQEIKQKHLWLRAPHLLKNAMCANKIWKWSLFIQPTNPFEVMNIKDIKNRIVSMDFPAYKIRNPQYEFTKATYILEDSSSKRKIFMQFLVRTPTWIRMLERSGITRTAIIRIWTDEATQGLQSTHKLLQHSRDFPPRVPSFLLSEKEVRIQSGRAVIMERTVYKLVQFFAHQLCPSKTFSPSDQQPCVK